MDKQNNIFKCNICIKQYKSYKSLWTHNNTYHNNKSTIVENTHIKAYTCNICNKIFNNRSTKSMHLKKCKIAEKSEITELKEEIYELKKIIGVNNSHNTNKSHNTNIHNDINTQNNTNNSNNNNTIQNNLTINQIGKETYSNLPIEDIKKFIKNGNYLINIVELLNFNEKLPENHNFCNTSLEGKYISVLDTETNTVNKVNKNELYDKILNNSFQYLNDMVFRFEYDEEFKTYFKDKYKTKLENDTIYLTESFYKDKSHKNRFNKDINQLSYNKNNIVKKTWRNLIKKLIEDDFSDISASTLSSDNSNSDSDSD
jgi:hypothetical protein